MTKKEQQRRTEQQNRLWNAGISTDDADTLRRISMTLHRWHELECGDGSRLIERDEKTGKPIMVYSDHRGNLTRHPITDREAGALRQLRAIMSKYEPAGLGYYVQGDPRGAALYIIRPGDVPDGENVNAYYTRGIAVY